MSSKIRVLHDTTINKIAAGEVIENPSSVVKELVENSIDAGSSDICVEISAGGRQLIRITDNGCGMNNDDALLCLERHATSKIKDINDLHTMMTMGFRGEAIPSIASISKFTLLTRPQQESQEQKTEATLIIVEGGKIIKCCSAERSPGTTIEVKSLFFNVPVRKKFQRSPTYDENEILKIMTHLSLANPQIKFQLISNQKTILSTPQEPEGTFIDLFGKRIAAVIGSDFFSALLPIDYKKENIHIRGYIGKPSYHRHNRTGQFLYINSRSVVSPLVSYAIKEGYSTALPANRFPVFVIHMSMPGDLVDVNVHPQKKEVRLRQEFSLKSTIIEAVEKALQQDCPFSSDWTFQPMPQKEEIFEPFPTPIKVFNPIPRPTMELPPLEIRTRNEEPPKKIEPQLVEVRKSVALPAVIATIPYFIIATVEKENEKQLCLIDQQAAQQRIFFDQMTNQIAPTQLQSLLIPITLELTNLETNILLSHLDEFNRLGICVKEFGQNTFIVDSIPTFFKESEIEAIILEMIDELSQFKESKIMEREKAKKMAFLASRQSFSQNKLLNLQEANALLKQLMASKDSSHSPDGKHITKELSYEALKTLF